jgi:hypothetical protein
MSLKKGDQGPEVRLLQEALIDCGLSLPKFGADGSLGSETLTALASLFDSVGRKGDDDAFVVSDKELAFVLAYRELMFQPTTLPGVEFIDRRKFAAQAHGEEQWPVRDRKWSAVTGICLHQTACWLGERPARYDAVGAHFCVTRMGKVIWLHDLNRRVVHGNGWNDGTVGIEFDGLYAGVEGDQKTVWNDPSTPHREEGMVFTPEAAAAGRQLVRYIYEQATQNGAKMKALVAHRQSSQNRRNDPGSAIWKAVALPMHKELGLTDGGIGFKLKGGYAIPGSWDPRCKGIGY